MRKEGSRGGRADFKWEDVKQDSQRENYLGHSLMAPVGRWQKGRDLNWYAKSDNPAIQSATESLAEEKRRIKEAEEDAMLAAMGLPVPQRASTNANLTPLGEKASQADIKAAIKDIAANEIYAGASNAIHYEEHSGQLSSIPRREGDILSGDGLERERPNDRSREDGRGRHSQQEPRKRARRGHEGDKRNNRSRSRSRSRRRRRRSRSRSSGKEREKYPGKQRQRHRSRSNGRQREEDQNGQRRRHPDDGKDRSGPYLQDGPKYERHQRRSRSPFERLGGYRRR